MKWPEMARQPVLSRPVDGSTPFPGSLSLPPEQPLDIGELEFHVSGAAVVALAGIGRRLHLAQQRVHPLALETAAGTHRAVAGHGGRDVHEPALERQRLL